MGAAEEWLSPGERADVAENLLTNPQARGHEIWAHCPFHVEGTPGGAFSYNYVEDVAKCMSCGEASDLIGVFNAVQGRDPSDPDGFKAFKERYAPGAASRPWREGAHAGEKRERVERRWAPRATDLPEPKWMERATAFVEHAAARLQESPEVLAQLKAWGIAPETAAKCKLGWNERDKYPTRSSWGQPKELKEDGKERKIWLPEGLVLPMFADGKVVKIKIRRPHPERGKESLKDRKYWEVNPGGSKRYFVYGRPEWLAWVIIETERDAAMVWQHSHGMRVGVMGTGSASARPDAAAAEILRRSALILVALDNDQAGGLNAKWWLDEFPLAVRWPAPPSAGKDPGDAIGQGLDIAAWVQAGLPSHVRRKLAGADRLNVLPKTASDGPEGLNKTEEISNAPEAVENGAAGAGDAADAPQARPVIPGVDWNLSELREMWDFWPPTWPGRERYFEFRGLAALYPIRIVRTRRAGGAAEEDGIGFRIHAGWEAANPEPAARARVLWADDDVFRTLADVDWREAPVEPVE